MALLTYGLAVLSGGFGLAYGASVQALPAATSDVGWLMMAGAAFTLICAVEGVSQ